MISLNIGMHSKQIGKGKTKPTLKGKDHNPQPTKNEFQWNFPAAIRDQLIKLKKEEEEKPKRRSL